MSEILRDMEYRLSAGDQRIKQAASDDELLGKWLWIGSIAGGLFCFLLFPALLLVFGGFLPAFLSGFLWAALKVSMAAVLVILLAAIAVTTGAKDD